MNLHTRRGYQKMLYYRKEEGDKDDIIPKPKQREVQELPGSSEATVPETTTEGTGRTGTTNVDGLEDVDRGHTTGRPTKNVGNERDSDVRPHSATRHVSRHVTKNQFTIEQNEAITQGEVARFNDNYKAIKLLKEDKSFYTKEKLSTLSRYTGCIDSETSINKTSHW